LKLKTNNIKLLPFALKSNRPLCNLAIGGALIGVYYLLRASWGTWYCFLLYFVGYTNVGLAAFNMLPGE
jgi:hypothetical protein